MFVVIEAIETTGWKVAINNCTYISTVSWHSWLVPWLLIPSRCDPYVGDVWIDCSYMRRLPRLVHNVFISVRAYVRASNIQTQVNYRNARRLFWTQLTNVYAPCYWKVVVAKWLVSALFPRPDSSWELEPLRQHEVQSNYNKPRFQRNNRNGRRPQYTRTMSGDGNNETADLAEEKDRASSSHTSGTKRSSPDSAGSDGTDGNGGDFNDVELDPEKRREVRKMRRVMANRRSARESRERRKKLLVDLQDSVENLTSENADLSKENLSLRRELASLIDQSGGTGALNMIPNIQGLLRSTQGLQGLAVQTPHVSSMQTNPPGISTAATVQGSLGSASDSQGKI